MSNPLDESLRIWLTLRIRQANIIRLALSNLLLVHLCQCKHRLLELCLQFMDHFQDKRLYALKMFKIQ